MKKLKILWVDDDWDQPNLQLLADELADKLMVLGVQAAFDRVLPFECINRLMYEQEKYELIITDHVFDRHTPPSNGSQIVEALSSRMKVIPPIILLTRFLQNSEYYGIVDSKLVKYYRKFQKDVDSILALAHSIKLLAQAPPLNIMIISDVHCGFVGRRHEARSQEFYEKFLRELRLYAFRQWKINYIVVTGDLAWRKQDEDLADARDLLMEIMRTAGLSDPHALQFCIGNHDLNLSNQVFPLDHYQRFLDSLRAVDNHYVARYMAYQTNRRRLGALTDQVQSLYTDFDPTGNVLFASLNSCASSVNPHDSSRLDVRGQIGTAQWSALEESMSDPSQDRSLRIALLHHPLFAAPGGYFDDEPPITDQAQAFHRLTKMGFQIAIHGHSHFACMYEQRMRVLNPSVPSDRMSRLVVIGAPTLAAEPSSTSPSRQYMILSVGAPEAQTGERKLSLHTRAYSEHSSDWSDAQSLPQGVFAID